MSHGVCPLWSTLQTSPISPNLVKPFFLLLACHIVLWTSHGVRFFLGNNPLSADRRFPPFVLGPELNPPWSLQRPLLYKSFRLQGVPALVLAPHIRPLSSSGKSGSGGLGHPKASRSRSITILSNSRKKRFHFSRNSGLLILISFFIE